MERKRYCYEDVIQDFHLKKEFRSYQRQHPKISFRRQARAFLLKKGIDYHLRFYEEDFKILDLSEKIRIARTPWVNED